MTESRFPIWHDYLNSSDAWGEEQARIKADQIRPDCHPFCLLHPSGSERDGVVLLHGLSDSPWFMREIGWSLHQQAGWNVYVPLLQGHGLKQPNSMQGVSDQIWLRNSAWAVEQARLNCRRVSVGGLSTGGAIATLMAFRDQDGENMADGSPQTNDHSNEAVINGGIMLYSAALRLRKKFLIKGRTLESLLRSPIASILDMVNELKEQHEGIDTLIGDHPYRYAKIDIGAAKELAKIIDLLDQKRRMRFGGPMRGLQKPLFVVHSDADSTADIRALENLCQATRKHGSGNVDFFRIASSFQIPHASTVLAETAFGLSGSPLEPANPFFKAMISAALASTVVNPASPTTSPIHEAF